jgi:hypothetical protein
MVRNRGKKALYEVMSKARVKSEPSKTVKHIQPIKSDKDAPAVEQKSDADVPKSTAKWWRKPRIVQLNAGRIEFSMPYQIAIVLLLAFIIVILVSYRLGQVSYRTERRQASRSDNTMPEMDNERSIEKAVSDIPQPSGAAENSKAETEVAEPVEPTGNNVIVLVEYHSLPDLAPVQAHFAEHGIELVIDPQSGSYFLQTKQLYDNPSKPGTDGYKALQKIKEVGKEYKAPEGYETFAPHYFSDAYGKKVK